jgi:hypothetical protein
VYADAIERLTTVLERIRRGETQGLYPEVTAQREVLNRFRPYFSQEHLPKLSEQEVWDFLAFKNNKHWTGLDRHRAKVTADMPKLRKTLQVLLDESKPIDQRLRYVRPRNGKNPVPSLGRAIITPILLVSYPDRYGVLNTTVESGMKEVGVWPTLQRGSDFADKYLAVNEILLELASELGTDLWTLDALWWGVLKGPSETPVGEDERPPISTPPVGLEPVALIDQQTFGLEKYLQEFLLDNWDHTELGREWALLDEDGEIIGSQYDTREIGRIDLLARHRKESRWLVIELKRGRASDIVVGQILRYCAWVEEHLAAKDEMVEGLIIALDHDTNLRYALKRAPGVRAVQYQVSFTLGDPIE